MNRKLDAALAETLGYEVEFVDTSHVPSDTFPHLGVWKYFTGDGWVELPDLSTGNGMLWLEAEMVKRRFLLHLDRFVFANDAKGVICAHFVELDAIEAEKTGLPNSKVIYLKKAREDKYISHSAHAATMPDAVCLAAYKALTGEDAVL